MRNTIKLFGIITLMVVIGFTAGNVFAQANPFLGSWGYSYSNYSEYHGRVVDGNVTITINPSNIEEMFGWTLLDSNGMDYSALGSYTISGNIITLTNIAGGSRVFGTGTISGNTLTINYPGGGQGVYHRGNVTDRGVIYPPRPDADFTGTWFIILSNGMAVDIRDHNSNNGVAVHQWTRHNGTSQQWRFTRNNDGTYTITNVRSNRVLDIQNSRIRENGALAQQWQNNNTPNQRWRIIAVGEFFNLQNVASGKNLDMSRSNFNNRGHQFHQWDNNGGENQRFRLERVQ